MSNLKARPCDEVAIRASRGEPACAKQYQGWVLAAAVLGSTMAFVDESVVNVALPRIESDLGTTLAAMQWVVNAYTLFAKFNFHFSIKPVQPAANMYMRIGFCCVKPEILQCFKTIHWYFHFLHGIHK